jgi:hypothetical protein
LETLSKVKIKINIKSNAGAAGLSGGLQFASIECAGIHAASHIQCMTKQALASPSSRNSSPYKSPWGG